MFLEELKNEEISHISNRNAYRFMHEDEESTLGGGAA